MLHQKTLRQLRLAAARAPLIRSAAAAIAVLAFLSALPAASRSGPNSGPKLAPKSTWSLGPFMRPAQAPVIVPDSKAVFQDPILQQPVHWEALHTFNPAAVVRNGKIDVLYRAEDNSGDMQIGHHTSRIGLAESADGIHFTRRPAPAFYPAKDAQESREWPGGVEDPRIVESEDGRYVLTYTQWNRKSYTVGIAISTDLLHWTKYGPAFADAPSGKYKDLSYKSAGILTRLEKDRLIAAKLKGKYWMYWGEIKVHLATSDDLIHWTPVEDLRGNPVVVLEKRAGHFDSSFPEVGPPPLLTSKGILLIYNGKNSDWNGKAAAPKATADPVKTIDVGPERPVAGDPHLGANAYAAGQALFAADNPAHLIERAGEPFLKPEMPYEKTGQYTAGTTFAEGLVRFNGKWFLYYGCADSKVGVVVSSGAGPSL